MAKFGQKKGVELSYSTALRKVARIVGGMVAAHVTGATIRDPKAMQKQLELYSEALTPWANLTAAKFISSVTRKNQAAWAAQSKKLSRQLNEELAKSKIGEVSRQLQREQVALIKSLPTEAGIRAQNLAAQALANGERASEVAQELANTEGVTLSRATLIARTEIAKADSAITRARAEYVGATQYIWRAAGDADTRESHAEVDGKVFDFNDPPTLSDGMTGHPGEFPNCRCYAEPIIEGII